ncbi:hypothetical protein U9M48_009594 [Paspalum notatum var. saurae]|uniref:Uncharacterized protein n=1 Tax=Paspalum notatum var. saurae TaxID=547442 RepID=A0AAQ3WF90_PASNO
MAVAANVVRDQRGPMTPIRTEPFIVDRQHIETGGAIPATALRGPSPICNHSWSSTNAANREKLLPMPHTYKDPIVWLLKGSCVSLKTKGPAIYSGLCTILASIEQTSAEAKLMCNVASDEGCCWSHHQCHSGNQQGAPGWRFSGELVSMAIAVLQQQYLPQLPKIADEGKLDDNSVMLRGT